MPCLDLGFHSLHQDNIADIAEQSRTNCKLRLLLDAVNPGTNTPVSATNLKTDFTIFQKCLNQNLS